MSVTKDLMLPGTLSGRLQHYENFSMEIDICIELKTHRKNFLKHPLCDASSVAELARRGESLRGISENLGVSRYIVKHVLHALDMRTNRQLRSPIDPLHHPKIEIEAVRSMRQQGKTIAEIAAALRVGKRQLNRVISAFAANGLELENHSDHAGADPSVVMQLIAQGQALSAIAKHLDLSLGTIRRAVMALQEENPSFSPSVGRHCKRAYKYFDYLQHPKCRAVDVQNLRKLGYTRRRIAEELGVSTGTLCLVLCAMKQHAKRSQPSATV